MSNEKVLNDIAMNLEFVSKKDAENDNKESYWHKERPQKKKKHKN